MFNIMTKREIAKSLRHELHGRSDSFKSGAKQGIFLVASVVFVSVVYYLTNQSFFWALVTAAWCVTIWNAYKYRTNWIIAMDALRRAEEIIFAMKGDMRPAVNMEEIPEKEIPFEIDTEGDPVIDVPNDRFEVDIQRNLKEMPQIGFKTGLQPPSTGPGIKKRLPESYAEWCKRIGL